MLIIKYWKVEWSCSALTSELTVRPSGSSRRCWSRAGWPGCSPAGRCRAAGPSRSSATAGPAGWSPPPPAASNLERWELGGARTPEGDWLGHCTTQVSSAAVLSSPVSALGCAGVLRVGGHAGADHVVFGHHHRTTIQTQPRYSTTCWQAAVVTKKHRLVCYSTLFNQMKRQCCACVYSS